MAAMCVTIASASKKRRLRPFFIPSADRKSCPVYECKAVDFDDDFPILRLRRE
jgi:hypothetical protein